jgi:hypothetical protein
MAAPEVRPALNGLLQARVETSHGSYHYEISTNERPLQCVSYIR